MTVAVVTFPGSNCDADCMRAVQSAASADATRAWHKDPELPSGTRAVILPGGFSYGDYLRVGAMAAHSPVMAAVKRFADDGGPVLGICNGFQVLCELGLLPGALMQNKDGRFVCKLADLVVEAGGKGLLGGYKNGQRIQLPVAHGDGNYFAAPDELDRLESEGRIAFRYADADDDGHGSMNGARRAVAGVLGGPKDNVLGLMPHPERRAEARLGGDDGLPLIAGLIQGVA